MASRDDKSANDDPYHIEVEEASDTLQLAIRAVKCFRQFQFHHTIWLCHAIYKKNVKQLGNNHELSLECQTNIARMQTLIYEYDQAIKNFTYVYETRLQKNGFEDFKTQKVFESLIMALKKQRRYKEISKLYTGLKHENELKYKLAVRLKKEGKLKAAMMFFEEVYKKRLETLGKNHDQTENCVFSMADILKKQERYYDACKLYYEVKGGYMYQTAMAEDLCQIGKYEEALIIFQERYDRDSEIWGIDEPETTLVHKEMIAKVYQALNRVEECLQAYQEVIQSRNKSLVKFHGFASDAVDEFVKLFVQVENADKWMDFLRKNQEEVSSILGPYHIHSLWVLYCLGYALAYRREYIESLAVFNSLSEKLSTKDPENLKALKSKFPIICVHALLGNIASAREVLVNVFRDFLRLVENKIRVPKGDILMLHRLREFLNMCSEMSENELKIMGFHEKIIEIMDTQRFSFLNKSERA